MLKEEAQISEGDGRAKRKRRWKTAARIFSLVCGCVLLPFFVVVVWTGYLTWIGITVGIVYLAPGVVSPIAGLAGKKRLEGFLSWLSIGMPILATLVVAVTLALPKRDSTGWRSYSFDAELAALEAERAVPDEENAALRYDAALTAVDTDDRPEFAFDGRDLREELSRQPWKSEDHPQASAWLDSREEIVAELLRIGQMEQCQWPICTNAEFQWTVPHEELLYGAQLLLAESNRCLGEGRLNEAMQTYFSLLGTARHLRQQTHLMDLSASSYPESRALKMIRYLLVHSDLSAEDIGRIAAHLPDTASAWRQDAERLLKFDEYRFAQFMAPAYEINERGQVRFAAWLPVLSESSGRTEHARMAKLGPLYYHLNMPSDPQGLWPMANRESARIARALESDSTLPDLMEELDPFGNIATLLARIGANWARYAGRITCFDTHLYAVFPQHCAASASLRRGTWLVLGLRQYRDQHGQWPKSLDSISEHVPAEAFLDPTSGGPFVYSCEGNSFKLYSTGVNGIDEGGRHRYISETGTSEDDIAIWPPQPSD